MPALVGLGAVMLEAVLSGYASVYFERILKSNDVQLSVWDRNVQLAFHSTWMYSPIVLHNVS